MVSVSSQQQRRFQPVSVAEGPRERPTGRWRERHHLLELGAVGALVAYALAVRVLVAVQLPPWQGPDEPKHFEYVRMLVDMRGTLWTEHRLLRPQDAPGNGAAADSPAAVFERAVIASMARHHFWAYVGQTPPDPAPANFFDLWQGKGTQLHRPSLYYALSAPVVAPLVNAPIEQQLLAVRMVSAVLGALAVVVAYATGRAASRNDAFVGVIAAAFVATLPMSVFLGGNVNIDNLATLVGGSVALGLARGVMLRFGRLEWLLVLGGSAGGLATKREFVGVLPTIGLVILVWAMRNPDHVWRKVLLAAASTLAFIVAVGIWSGGLGLVGTALSQYALNEPNQAERLLQASLSLQAIQDLLSLQWTVFFWSFWGIFGWFSVPLSPDLYAVLGLVTQVSVLGLAIAVAATRTPRFRWLIAIYSLMIVTMTVLAFAIALSYFSSSELPQGRHIFGVLVPIAVLFAVGVRTWLPVRYLGMRVPAAMCVLLLIALDGVAYVQSFAPHYVLPTAS